MAQAFHIFSRVCKYSLRIHYVKCVSILVSFQCKVHVYVAVYSAESSQHLCHPPAPNDQRKVEICTVMIPQSSRGKNSQLPFLFFSSFDPRLHEMSCYRHLFSATAQGNIAGINYNTEHSYDKNIAYRIVTQLQLTSGSMCRGDG